MLTYDVGQFPVDQYVRQWFPYGSPLSGAMAAAGATAQVQINIATDAPFECRWISLHILQASLEVFNYGGTINVTFAARGETLTSAPIPCGAMVGNGQQPYYMSPPQIFPAGVTVTAAVISNVATATTFYFVMHGNKLFKKAGASV